MHEIYQCVGEIRIRGISMKFYMVSRAAGIGVLSNMATKYLS
jgi:hypothetical protein